ncbi:MAG TPA: ThiF family adenylyltransferase [Candidatus Angelobacter sp.]|jgi:adenylyltransferase/sulfurtransferase|nr:ThiF family adenylyltransferase [Candidatus Angelobacter sp.]
MASATASIEALNLEALGFAALEDRYSRQRLIPSWDQEKVSNAKILVAGAGALGNEVLKNLALLGSGHILIVDFDRVEVSNLSRSVLFREDDLGLPKASTAARALQRLNPEIFVEAIDGDLECDLGLGEIRAYDIVLGCLDSIYARWLLNRACQRAGRPWINAGINASVGEVSMYVPGPGPCFECGMTRHMWQQIHERRSCMSMPRKSPAATIPTTAIITSLTAALQVNEALAWIHGRSQLSSGEMVMVSLSPYSLSSFTTSMKADCLAHDHYSPSVFIDASPDEITSLELLSRIPGATALQLDFDVVEGWLCCTCGEQTASERLSLNSAAHSQCPHCQVQRSPQLTHEIGRFDRLANVLLGKLGVPPRSILRVKTESGPCFVELAGTHSNRSIR